MSPWLPAAPVCLLALALVGCSAEPAAVPASPEPAGSAGSTGSGGQASSNPLADNGPLDPVQACLTRDAGPSPLRRLTRFELNNTLRDLVGDASHPADVLPPEELGNGFGNDAEALSVSRLMVEKQLDLTRGVAERVVAAQPLDQLLGCDAAQLADMASGCLTRFIREFSARAYRRPVTDEDLQAPLQAFAKLSATETPELAVRAALQTLLISPHFGYRVEAPVAAAGMLVPVPAFELASRLSYLLWSSMPDAALLEAAQQGQLATAEQVKAQAIRLLQDPRAREVVSYFNGVFFRLEGSEGATKNAVDFPEFSGMAPLLKQEALLLLDDVVWNQQGGLPALFSANHSFMNKAVADYYGISGPQGEAFERVEVAGGRRAGLLTSGIMQAVLTPGVHSNPTVRGAFILERLLCTPPPDPPSNLNVMEPMYTPDQTTRERFATHAASPACMGCHSLIDPIGFAFENYDAAGRWRDMDNGKPVDSSAVISGDVDIAGPNQDAVELGAKLASSGQVQRCFVRHWFSFAYGRGQSERDLCNRAELEAAFAQSGFEIPALLVALTQTDSFRFRTASSP